MDRLIVKNFGPLKDVDIELNKINLFIGENGSGKSVLGKLITILLDFENHMIDEKNLFKKFQEYYIDYIKNETTIKFLVKNESIFEIRNKQILSIGRIVINEHPIMQNEIKKGQDRIISENKLTTYYIPAERNLISLFNRYVTTFITADIPLPKFLLNFSSEYTRAREAIQKLKFLNVEYQLKNGQEYIFYRDEESLLLEQSSSGIQSALPLYLTVKYFAKKYHAIVIEEPEQNLFPKAQKETVEYIVEQISDGSSLFMMTHSPYILTALNNLILANDVKEQKGLEAIEGIVKEEQCVVFEQVSAYMLVDGKSINIMDKEDRLIGVNLIDAISDEVSSTFDTLLAKLD